MAFLDLDEELATIGYGEQWGTEVSPLALTGKGSWSLSKTTMRADQRLRASVNRADAFSEKQLAHFSKQMTFLQTQRRDRRAHAAQQARLRTHRSTRNQKTSSHVAT